MDAMNPSNVGRPPATPAASGEPPSSAAAAAGAAACRHAGPQEAANAAWAPGTLSARRDAPRDAAPACAARAASGLTAQNTSNGARAPGAPGLQRQPVTAAAAKAAAAMGTPDAQGPANSARGPASPQAQGRAVTGATAAAAEDLAPARRTRVASDEELHSLAKSILALAWAFAFVPPFGPALRAALWECLSALGRHADWTFKLPAGLARAGARPSPASGEAEAEAPALLFEGRGMLVVYKPPGWEVDTAAASGTDAPCLSAFLQRRTSPQESPLLYASARGFGFVHRLDVASSGLVLVGTTFEGLFALQWQKNLYEIDREYLVVLGWGEK